MKQWLVIKYSYIPMLAKSYQVFQRVMPLL